MEQSLAYYTSQSAITDPGPHAAFFDDLPVDLLELFAVIQGVLLHRNSAKYYGVQRTPQQNTELGLRTMQQRLGRMLELDPAPLTVPRKVTPLIEKGVLRNFIYDLDTAGRAGARPTGHGINRRLTNLVIDPGEIPYQKMLDGIQKGLLVHDFLGLGQGNPINGEFSVNVFLGYKIENGQIMGRVKDVMMAGNAFEALKNITAISQEREWVSGPYAWLAGLMPYIKIDKLSVTAK